MEREALEAANALVQEWLALTEHLGRLATSVAASRALPAGVVREAQAQGRSLDANIKRVEAIIGR